MKSPLLVTGSHRSGKGYMIKMLNLRNEFNIVEEPLNISNNTGWIGSKIQNYFLYIDEANSSLFKKEFDKLIYKYDYRFFKQLSFISNFNDFKKVIKDYIVSIKYKYNNNRLLIDDPFAVFSAEWFYKEYNADVIIMIRHPASFVSSLKLLKYEFPFSHLSNQKNLVEFKLKKYKSQLDEYTIDKKSIVEQGVFLWMMIYDVVNQFRNKYKTDWMFVRFEDIIRYPETNIHEISQYVGLPTNSFITELEKAKSSSISDKEIKLLDEQNKISNSYSTKDHLCSYKKILTEQEIAYVKEKAKNIWCEFYSDEDWP